VINETRFVRRESKGFRSCERSVLLVMRDLGFCGLNRVERRREDEIATRAENQLGHPRPTATSPSSVASFKFSRRVSMS
jgi:hypothetical protein